MRQLYISFKIDKIILFIFLVHFVISFYFNCSSQSESEGSTPFVFLLIPFPLLCLYVIRIFALLRYVSLDKISKGFLALFFYGLTSYLLYMAFSANSLKYNAFMSCMYYPISYIYISLSFKANPTLVNKLVDFSPWLLAIMSAIFLYFVPRSIALNGVFASLNTAYFVLLLYPLTMLNEKKWIKVFSTLLMLVVVFLSMKRGGIIAAILGFVGYYFLNLIIQRKRIFKNVIQLLIICFAISYIIVQVDEYANGRILERFEKTSNSGGEEARNDVYENVITHFSQSSLGEQLLGHGPDTSRLISRENLTAHNDFLEYLYNFGIIGLMLLLHIHLCFCSFAYKAVRFKKVWAFSAVYSYICIFILSMVSHILIYNYFLAVVLLWATLTSNLYRNENVGRCISLNDKT